MPVTVVAIVDYDMFPNKEMHISFHKTLDTQTHENDFTKLMYCLVELQKYRQHPKKVHNELEGYWLEMLANAPYKSEFPKSIDVAVRQAYEIMERSNWTPAQLAAYEKAIMEHKTYHDNMSIANEEGRAKGLKEGEAKGLNEAKIEIAKQMLAKQFSVTEVMELTHLTEAEIIKLSKF